MRLAAMLQASLLLGGLLGCGSDRPLTDQQFCSRQADNDPTVKQLIIKSAGSPQFQVDAEDRLRAARQDATVACLRSRGVVRPGGVERQKPS